MLDINGYEILGKIAAGGMATVWKARQLSLDRLVAIKILDAASLPDQEARDRFRTEAQLAAKLNHPGIVQVIDTGETAGATYLVMEYVDGPTVGDLIRQDGFLPEARALDITTQVARALAYAWEKHCLIHCDLKPDNLLVDRVSGLVKVADFGLARLIGLLQARTDSDHILGTPNYTAPEVSQGETDLDCRTDLYSLAATLYHMVTGVLPFREAPGSQAMNRHETDFLDDPTVVNPQVSAPVAWLIEKWMVKDRALRPHFWTLALKDLEAVRKGRLPEPPLPVPGMSTIRRDPGRAAVKPAIVVPPAEGPRKLVLRKSEMPAPPPPPRRRGGGLARAAGSLFSLLVTAAALYGVAWYHKVVPDPRDLLARFTAPDAAPAEPVPPEAPVLTAQSDAEEGVQDAGPWRNEDYLAGAKLFNQALADYTAFQKTRQNPEILQEVAENCRLAIEHFEACRDLAPEHINIGAYIDQCFGLIANVRHSTQLDTGADAAPTTSAPASRDDLIVIEAVEGPPGRPAAPRPSGGSSVVFVDDLAAAESSAPAPEPKTVTKLRLSLGDTWRTPNAGSFEYGVDLRRLLTRHVQPSDELEIESGVTLYPGVTTMSTARETARTLKQELPIRRALDAPGFPSGALFTYVFSGDFAGAQQLTLVVDGNDRVVMVQLNDARPAAARMEPALFSTNWKAYDFIHARKREDTDGLIAHRVRRNESLVRIDTELAAGDPAARRVQARVVLMMPAQMASVLLQVNAGP
jgi:serine/threonine protein kinase